MNYLNDAHAIEADLVALRRDLHSHPEVGLDLPQTRSRVLAALDGLPLEVTIRDDDSSIVAVLRSREGVSAQRSVLLRADMDALPVRETTGIPFAFAGDAMHACGHDLHTVMLVGAARLLSARRTDLTGDVVLMFQPGEEGYDGARRMISAGALDASGVRASAAYALHVTSARFGSGVVATRPGPLMAAADVLKVVVRGAGGHSSAPHHALDPITVAAEMVTSLQTMITRRFDAFDPVVLTVGYIQGGTLNNIIPDTAEFHAAVRIFSPKAQKEIAARTAQLCHGIASAYGLTAEVTWETLYPITINDSDEVDFVRATASALFGATKVTTMQTPMAGAEDFSRVLQEVPGALAFLGATAEDADPSTAAFNHSPLAIYDEAVLPSGAALLARLADDRLASLAASDRR
ncbi:M20 family metallopeptidase [Cryobacterium sp. Hb1]|uniref:M20 metallopeptidase family protein n=1 Tax=Cryobacterium sp. Hb1 TaxID=1259147 RepID=UPI001069223D|nr:M20 family metallopeptidase [Cryobacterium sp. Hb1]TFD70473.1 amidohydrolase [Cryobacterium sp. Hb1]